MQSPAYGHHTAHAGGENQNQKQPKEKDDATQEVADTEAGFIRRAPQLQSIHALHVRSRSLFSTQDQGRENSGPSPR